jgi:Carboxypeptidase regulatory-like domain
MSQPSPFSTQVSRLASGLSGLVGLSGLLAATLLMACAEDDDRQSGVSVVENEIYGRVLQEDGLAAVGVPVVLYKSDSAGVKVSQGVTDNQGQFRFASLPPGAYSALARRDSVIAFIDGVQMLSGKVNAGERKLRVGGKVRTAVVLRPGDEPTTVTAVVLGSDFRSTPKPDGDMGMDGMPEGALRIKVSTSLPGYLPLEATLTIISGKETKVDTLHLPQAR